MVFNEDEISRFMAKVGAPDKNGCTPWGASIDTTGYGRFRARRVSAGQIKAHRAAYMIATGLDIPYGLCVCHRCDNPPCVNPDHLFLGTHQDNCDDKMAKGRHVTVDQTGENNGSNKLTESDVAAIIEDLPKFNNKQIARRYGVTHSSISLIRRNKSWTHIPRVAQKPYASISRPPTT